MKRPRTIVVLPTLTARLTGVTHYMVQPNGMTKLVYEDQSTETTKIEPAVALGDDPFAIIAAVQSRR